jgi:hypothetical protein
VQSYLFDKSKGWTLDKAKAWFAEHQPVREHAFAVLPFQVLEKIVDKPLRIRGVAMTSGMSRNFNIYTPEELEAFAGKLVGAPVYVEHVAVPNAVGKVTKADWDGHALWYEAEIYDSDIADKIRKGLVQHVSVGADYEIIDFVDGKVPHGLHNAELSLVAVPGIPETNIQVLESLNKTAGHSASTSTCGGAPKGDVLENQKAVENRVSEAEWSTEYINDLPDDAFAYIEPGGEKDEQGKTVPRSLRHLPYKNAQGELDAEHVRNALARLDQTDIPAEAKAEARRRLCAAAKELGIQSAVCGLVEELELVCGKLAEKEQLLAEAERRLAAAEKAVEELRMQLQGGGLLVERALPVDRVLEAVDRCIMGKLPADWVLGSWGAASGGYRLAQDVRRGRLELERELRGC